MARHNVSVAADTMAVECWLAISSQGRIRVSVRQPSLEPNEITMRLLLKVPRAVFRKPTLQAEIVVPKEAGNPAVIEAGVLSAMKDAVKQAVGVDLSVTVIEP